MWVKGNTGMNVVKGVGVHILSLLTTVTPQREIS